MRFLYSISRLSMELKFSNNSGKLFLSNSAKCSYSSLLLSLRVDVLYFYFHFRFRSEGEYDNSFCYVKTSNGSTLDSLDDCSVLRCDDFVTFTLTWTDGHFKVSFQYKSKWGCQIYSLHYITQPIVSKSEVAGSIERETTEDVFM